MSRRPHRPRLTRIDCDLGTVTAGKLRNSGDTVGIGLGGAQVPAWNSYISFHTSDYFLKGFGGKFTVDHNGDLVATSATITGTITGTSVVAASSFTAANANFSGAITVNGTVDTTGDVQADGTVFGAQVSTNDYQITTRPGFSDGTWRLQNATTLFLSYNGTDRFKFGTDGTAYADVAWTTFSPTPPLPAEDMTAGDWLEWAAEDARKPVKPYEGLPSTDHPLVIEEATRTKEEAEGIVEREVERYGKDISKIAIGTARWADAVHPEIVRLRAEVNALRDRLGLVGDSTI